jgi:cytochrome c peroxidase
VEADPTGYIAAFLDGIWLRAPYLHNGSVPSLRDLLNPVAKRPTVFYRGYDVYDPVDVGFIAQEEQAKRLGVSWDAVKAVATPYDVRWRSNGNAGHEYGVSLPDGDKDALIEYLKTL